MKCLLLVVLSLISLVAKPQTSIYFPFPDSAIVWRQEGYVQGNCCCGGSGPCLDENFFEYFLNGDTIIGANSYNKIYKTGQGINHIVASPPICPPGCSNYEYYYYNNSYSGGLRQDTSQRKVFFIPPTTTLDTLLYDFNLSVGDTLPSTWINYNPENYVTSIDSILIGSSYRKRFQLSSSASANEVTLIEGIGSSLGLLSPLTSNVNVSFHYNILNCVTINGLTIYPDTSAICSLISEVYENKNDLSFSVYPNPFMKELKILVNNYHVAEIILYDVTSRKLLQQAFITSITLNTELFPEGIYSYEIRTNGINKKGRIIKE